MPKYLKGEEAMHADMPVYMDAVYIVDGDIVQSPIFGTVDDLRREFDATEIRRCNTVARRLPMSIKMVLQ